MEDLHDRIFKLEKQRPHADSEKDADIEEIKFKLSETKGAKKKEIQKTARGVHQQFSQHMRLRYLSLRRPAKSLAQASLGIRVRPKIKHLAPLDGYACAFEE